MKTDNEIIAEFMGGWNDSNHTKSIGMNVPQDGNPHWEDQWYDYKDMKYAISWDWLMPVVEKIENIRHIGIDAIYLQIKGKQCQIWTYFDVKEFLRLTGDDKNDGNKFKVGHSAKTKIEATYHAVVDFIKWYNQQNQ